MFIVCCIAMTACKTTPQRSPLEATLSELADTPPLVRYSLEELEQIPDEGSQLFILSTAADSLISQNQPKLAQRILDSALELVWESFSGERLVEALLEIARGYIDAGVVIQSLSILEDALDIAINTEDNLRRGEQMQDIISACFSIGNDASDLLRIAVQQIYIIEDYQLRTELLLDTARRYQETGEAQRSESLLQQAIPAAGAIDSDLDRLQAFSLLAQRLASAGQVRLSQQYAQKAIDLFTTAASEGISRFAPNRSSEEQDDRISESLISLASTGYASEALGFSSLIGNPRLRLGALAQIARSFYSQGQFLQSDLVFERIFTTLERESPPDLVVSTLLNIAGIYLDLGDRYNARVYAGAVEIYFEEIESQAILDSLLLEATLLFGRLDDFSQAERLAQMIGDGFYSAQGLLGLSEILLSEITSLKNQHSDSLSSSIEELESRVRKILSEVDQISAELEYQADSVYASMSLQYGRIEDTELSLTYAAQIDSPFARARTLAELQGILPQNDKTVTMITGIWPVMR